MKVEAWIPEAATNMGGWRAGEVIWGNGHSYVMKWFDGGPDSARISRKFVRPSPDPGDVKLPMDLAAGAIVELYDGNLWKWAEIVRVSGRQFDVKFVGSTKVLTADRSALRPRLIYGEKGWTHKNDQIPIESAVPSRPIAGKNIKSKAIGNGIGNGGSNFATHAVKLGKTKMSNLPVDADIVRDVKRFQGNGDTRLFAKREELTASYNDNTEVMDVHPSHYLKKRHNETGNNVDCFLARRTDNDDDSRKSDTWSSTSSGSSSSGNNSNNNDRTVSGGDRVSATVDHYQENQEAEIQLLPGCNEEEQDSDNGTHHPANKVNVVMKQEEQHDRRVHGLELEAYVSVMKAFHATGLLTWAKEELLSNLRLELHVSSDEHLQVIRCLNGKKKSPSGPRDGHC